MRILRDFFFLWEVWRVCVCVSSQARLRKFAYSKTCRLYADGKTRSKIPKKVSLSSKWSLVMVHLWRESKADQPEDVLFLPCSLPSPCSSPLLLEYFLLFLLRIHTHLTFHCSTQQPPHHTHTHMHTHTHTHTHTHRHTHTYTYTHTHTHSSYFAERANNWMQFPGQTHGGDAVLYNTAGHFLFKWLFKSQNSGRQWEKPPQTLKYIK